MMIKLLFPQVIIGPVVIYYILYKNNIICGGKDEVKWISLLVVFATISLSVQRYFRRRSRSENEKHNISDDVVRNVAIIGAGPSGLVAAKILKEKGISCTVFEMMSKVGGAFRYRAYDGAEQVSSKFITAFSDFRFEEKDEDHVSLKDYCKYLERYCDRFDLWRHIQFSREVKHVRKIRLGGGYEVHHVVSGETNVIVDNFDAVLVASGLHLHENIPKIINFHKFKGITYHSAKYRNTSNPARFESRNVLVVGSGETGLDVAQQALEAGATNVTISSRSGWLSVPKQLPNGVPLDIYITNMFEASMEHRWIDRTRLKWIVATFFIRLFFFLGTGTSKGFGQWVGTKKVVKRGYHFVNKQAGPMPQINRSSSVKKGVSSVIPRFWIFLKRFFRKNTATISSSSSSSSSSSKYYCRHPGTIRVVPEIIDTLEDSLICKDGSKVQIGSNDVIVFATGYLQRFPFLPNRSLNSCSGEDNLPSQRGICSENEPRLGFIGFARPNVGAIPPVSELQVYWWIEMLRCAATGNKKNKLKPPTYKLLSKCHKAQSYGVDYGLYMETLAQDINARPSLVRLMFHPRLFLTYTLGQCFIPFYRINGPCAPRCEKKRQKLLHICETELWGALKRRGIGSNVMFLWITIQFGVVNLICVLIDWVLRLCFGIYIE